MYVAHWANLAREVPDPQRSAAPVNDLLQNDDVLRVVPLLDGDHAPRCTRPDYRNVCSNFSIFLLKFQSVILQF